jgi:phosphatidylserine/phosphatidylglycerophosphate/cardiolipin synthase-like enzyme
MAEILTTQEITNAIQSMISQAQKFVVIITYSIKLDEALVKLLSETYKKSVKITIIHGGERWQSYTLQPLSKLFNMEVFWNPKIHAKLYFNESQMIVTSMNFTELVKHTNIELGILLRRDQDTVVFEEAQRLVTLLKKSKSSIAYTWKGYCLTCAKGIPFDTSTPWCPTCYYKLSARARTEFPLGTRIREGVRYCHQCGKEIKAIIDDDIWMICEPCIRNG